MNYTIVVNDNGELKTISAAEFEKIISGGTMSLAINIVLDRKSAEEAAVEAAGTACAQMGEAMLGENSAGQPIVIVIPR